MLGRIPRYLDDLIETAHDRDCLDCFIKEAAMAFKPGQSGNPLGRAKKPIDPRSEIMQEICHGAPRSG